MSGTQSLFVWTPERAEIRPFLKRPQLKDIQEAVGGCIECIQQYEAGYAVDFFVNEEGRLRGMPITAKRRTDGMTLCGPIVGMLGEDQSSRFVTLTEWMDAFRQCFEEVK